MREPLSWTVFCRVVDNFGDAGVCWRLARQLVNERAARVELFIDHLDSLARLEPAVQAVDRQTVCGVEVQRWDGRNCAMTPSCDVVIEAFGCGLPEDYVRAMSASAAPPLWIVLEYLSAESWVPEHHGRPSPHPRLPLERYFFFPGFVEGTGGLLRETDLLARRDRFGSASRAVFWRGLGHKPVPHDALTISMFAYEHAPALELMACWAQGARRVVAAVPEGSLAARVRSRFGVACLPADRVLRHGALELRFLPFLPQERYDELLWACDVNFARGEDSFVRAQWAARPFLWNPYPQQERAHWRKLEAFLALYTARLTADVRAVTNDMMRLWNQIAAPGVTTASVWAAYVEHLAALRSHGAAWADALAEQPSLAENLAYFCRGRLQ